MEILQALADIETELNTFAGTVLPQQKIEILKTRAIMAVAGSLSDMNDKLDALSRDIATIAKIQKYKAGVVNG